MLPQVPHPMLGYTTQHGIVPKLSATPGRVVWTGPDYGQDTCAVLKAELGLDDEKIERLIKMGIVVAAPSGPQA